MSIEQISQIYEQISWSNNISVLLTTSIYEQISQIYEQISQIYEQISQICFFKSHTTILSHNPTKFLICAELLIHTYKGIKLLYQFESLWIVYKGMKLLY